MYMFDYIGVFPPLLVVYIMVSNITYASCRNIWVHDHWVGGFLIPQDIRALKSSTEAFDRTPQYKSDKL